MLHTQHQTCFIPASPSGRTWYTISLPSSLWGSNMDSVCAISRASTWASTNPSLRASSEAECPSRPSQRINSVTDPSYSDGPILQSINLDHHPDSMRIRYLTGPLGQPPPPQSYRLKAWSRRKARSRTAPSKSSAMRLSLRSPMVAPDWHSRSSSSCETLL